MRNTLPNKQLNRDKKLAGYSLRSILAYNFLPVNRALLINKYSNVFLSKNEIPDRLLLTHTHLLGLLIPFKQT